MVDNQSLRSKIKLLEGKVALTRDLESSLKSTEEQLEASERAREDLHDKLLEFQKIQEQIAE